MHGRRRWCSRARGVAWAVGLAMLLPVGCSEESDDGSAALFAAWKQAGLAPTVFMPTEMKALSPGACKQGKIDGVEAILCTYKDAQAARAAQPAGLAQVGETTGFAVTAGQQLLIVADRDGADPTGRAINRIATAFRAQNAASPPGDGGSTKPSGKGDEDGKPGGSGKKGKGS